MNPPFLPALAVGILAFVAVLAVAWFLVRYLGRRKK
jgi:hypothetical protein